MTSKGNIKLLYTFVTDPIIFFLLFLYFYLLKMNLFLFFVIKNTQKSTSLRKIIWFTFVFSHHSSLNLDEKEKKKNLHYFCGLMTNLTHLEI